MVPVATTSFQRTTEARMSITAGPIPVRRRSEPAVVAKMERDTHHSMAVCRRLARRIVREIGVIALGLTIAASAIDAQTPSAPAAPPAITSLRYDEDYSYLRDPGKRTGAWWESLKFIPLEATGWAFALLAVGVPVRFISRWLNGSSREEEMNPAVPPGSAS